MLPLLDEEVEYMKEFIEEEVVRRIKAIEDREHQDKDTETKKAYEEQRKKMDELEKKMKIIREKDERLKRYMTEQRSNAKKLNNGKVRDDQTEKIKRLEKLLEEETKKREFLEKQWNETQYDEEWDNGKDGWESWYEDEEDLEPKAPSGDSSYEMVTPLPSSKDSPKVDDDEPKSEMAQMIKLVMEGQQKAVEFMLKQATKTLEEKDLLNQEDQRIKVLELEPLKELTEHNASLVCGDWLHRIEPVIKNMSKRSSKYWSRLDEVIDERYKEFLKMTPTERLKLEPMKDPELCKEGYSKVKAIIMEMILKSIPLDLATEAAQKRLEEPTELMLMIMTKY